MYRLRLCLGIVSNGRKGIRVEEAKGLFQYDADKRDFNYEKATRNKFGDAVSSRYPSYLLLFIFVSNNYFCLLFNMLDKLGT